MSSVHVICIVFLLFLLPSLNDATARKFPYSAPSTTIFNETNNGGGGYVMMNPPHLNHRKGVPVGRTVRNCMPKGLRHSSAPSRYVNYLPLGAFPCLTRSDHSKSKSP